MPTEVEWEYAAARGAPYYPERLYAYGTTWDCDKVVGSVSPCGSYFRTANVGSKSPAGDTPQGLADMSGNVWEWSSDNVQADGNVESGADRYYFNNDNTGTTFVIRGGCWGNTDEYFFRAARRSGNIPYFRYSNVGFRVVRP